MLLPDNSADKYSNQCESWVQQILMNEIWSMIFIDLSATHVSLVGLRKFTLIELTKSPPKVEGGGYRIKFTHGNVN